MGYQETWESIREAIVATFPHLFCTNPVVLGVAVLANVGAVCGVAIGGANHHQQGDKVWPRAHASGNHLLPYIMYSTPSLFTLLCYWCVPSM